MAKCLAIVAGCGDEIIHRQSNLLVPCNCLFVSLNKVQSFAVDFGCFTCRRSYCSVPAWFIKKHCWVSSQLRGFVRCKQIEVKWREDTLEMVGVNPGTNL